MPNWCTNKLIVTGRSLDVWDFYTENSKDTRIDFNKSVPQPKFENKDDWYEWNIENWGTKWQPFTQTTHLELNENRNGHLVIYFETAWSPPMKWWKTIVEKYPRLDFKIEYFDDSLEWKGVCETKDGNIVLDEFISTPEGEKDE